MCKGIAPVLLSTPNWDELNAEQAETESNHVKKVVAKLDFKGEKKSEKGGERRDLASKAFTGFQIKLQPLPSYKTVRNSQPQNFSLCTSNPLRLFVEREGFDGSC